MKRLSLSLLIGLFLLTSFGCYERTIAPELTYDQEQVDLIDEEVKKLEW